MHADSTVTETTAPALDAAEDSEQADKDREYLEEWYFKAFGTYNIQYNFSNELEEIHSMMEEDYVEA